MKRRLKVSRSIKNVSISKKKKKKKEIKHTAPSATPFIGSRRLESEKNQAAAEIVPWKSHRSTGSHPREYPSPLHSSPLLFKPERNAFCHIFPRHGTLPRWRRNSCWGERARWKKGGNAWERMGGHFRRRRNVFTWAELRNAIHAVYNNFCLETPCTSWNSPSLNDFFYLYFIIILFLLPAMCSNHRGLDWVAGWKTRRWVDLWLQRDSCMRIIFSGASEKSVPAGKVWWMIGGGKGWSGYSMK